MRQAYLCDALLIGTLTTACMQTDGAARLSLPKTPSALVLAYVGDSITLTRSDIRPEPSR